MFNKRYFGNFCQIRRLAINLLIFASMTSMSRRNLPEILAFTGGIFLTRFAFRSHLLYDLDSIDFALGMRHFDPLVYQPHPPSYYLYVCLGRLLNLIFHNANFSLVLLSILASCGLIIVIYLFALEWFGVSAARFAALLFLFSPLSWFHGIVALTYIVEAFFSGLLGWLCWRISSGNRALLLPGSILFGLCAGIRPSSFVFLAPLFLFSLRRMGIGRIILALTVLLVVLLAWFVPMIVASGGLHAYFGALSELWKTQAGKKTVFNSAPTYTIVRAFTIGFIYLLTFGLASIAPFGLKNSASPADRQKVIFTLAWITPALCFFTFIFLYFVNSGYLLLLLAPACLWLGLWISCWYTRSPSTRPLKFGLIAACVAVNTLIFLAAPLYCSYRSVRRLEAEVRSVQSALPQIGPPDTTLIVSFDSHFLGFRHAGYYLPQYHNIEYPEVKMPDGIRAFAMYGQDTSLITRLPSSYSRFVLFPLPASGTGFVQYLKKVTDKLPPQDLHTTVIDHHTFVTAPATDLHFLFPKLAAASK